MEKNAKILITGINGMVGERLYKRLKADGFTNVVGVNRQMLDLTDSSAVDSFLANQKPDYVFMIAAKVGGIKANMSDPVHFLTDNLKIQLNMFEACHKYKTKKNLFLGSSCIYPRESPQPMKEEYLLTGPVEPTNEGYALSKIAGLKMAEYYHRQYGMNVVCPMPSNIYGPNDHYDLERSHVLSALVMRFVNAVDDKLDSVTLWGTGSAKREFIHVDDVVDGMLFFMYEINSPNIVNLGPGDDVSIKELAELIARLTGFTGKIFWDTTKPDGMPRKCMDVTKLHELGFKTSITFENGVMGCIEEYKKLKKGTSK